MSHKYKNDIINRKSFFKKKKTGMEYKTWGGIKQST